MVAVALDIETCPLPTSSFSEVQADRYEKELAREQEKNPDQTEEEASQRARTFHPYLGWISCVSVVRGPLGGDHRTPHSWTASTPSEEEALLTEFWAAVEELRDGMARSREDLVWTTFNGKDFDVPYLTARSTHHGVQPTGSGLLNTYPYSHTPHADLQTIWPSSHYSLEEMCAHLGVPSSKDGLEGSEVAEAVADGRMDEVEAYCERDAVATYRCLAHVKWAI